MEIKQITITVLSQLAILFSTCILCNTTPTTKVIKNTNAIEMHCKDETAISSFGRTMKRL